jgi:hypothetical protein
MLDKGDALDKEHEIVKKLIKPGMPTDLTYFVGYLGKSTSPNHVRLYLSLTFDEWLDIPKDKILHHADVPEENLAFGGTCIWIPRDVEIIHTRNEITKMQAQFLEGEFMQAYGDIEEASSTTLQAPIKPKTALVAGVWMAGGRCPTGSFCPSKIPCDPSSRKCPTLLCPRHLEGF